MSAQLSFEDNLLATRRRETQRWRVAYYTENAPEVDDATYDAAIAELAELEGQLETPGWQSPQWQVTPTEQNHFVERKHATPMLSLANAYSPEELADWETTLRKLLPDDSPQYVAELKVDGVAISIIYEQGKLVAAVTRGDGTRGDDVTRNVKTLRGLPHRLSEPLDLEIRGEVYFTLTAFNALNKEREKAGEPAFKNPRNATAGTLRTLDTTQVRRRAMNLAVYALASPSPHVTHWETLLWLKEMGFPISEHTRRCVDIAALTEFYTGWEHDRHTLDFHIDGVVVKVDQLDLRDAAGMTSKSPRWAVAMKFGAEQAETQLLDVTHQVGRTGVLTPVAELQPVELAGTTVSRATLHNYDQTNRLGLHMGDWVTLEKGGDIIPKVVSVNTTKRSPGALPVCPPENCPSCNQPIAQPAGEVDFYCLNPACPAQQAERIRHFVSRKAMDVDTLGPALIEQLLAKGLVQNVADLFLLTQDQLAGLERMGTKSAENVIKGLEQAKTRSLFRFLFGLGIRFVGERAAQAFSRHFGTLERLREADMETLEAVPDIGTITAQSLRDYLDEQWDLIAACLANGVSPTADQATAAADGALAGKTVVITGTLSEPRGTWKQRLERAGAKVTGSVSAKTDYLLAGESAGSKLDTAQQLGVRIVEEEEMAALLAEEPMPSATSEREPQ